MAGYHDVPRLMEGGVATVVRLDAGCCPAPASRLGIPGLRPLPQTNPIHPLPSLPLPSVNPIPCITSRNDVMAAHAAPHQPLNTAQIMQKLAKHPRRNDAFDISISMLRGRCVLVEKIDMERPGRECSFKAGPDDRAAAPCRIGASTRLVDYETHESHAHA
jgi:hypothetical protein